MNIRIALVFYCSALSLLSMSMDTVHGDFLIDGNHITVESNRSMAMENAQVDRIIVAIQGHKRDAKTRALAVMKVAHMHGAADRVLIISPHFKGNSDMNTVGFGEFVWSDNGWKQGNNSLKYDNTSRISSFAALDRLLTELITCGNFPNVRKIIITGHSAGGQFAQRYALTSKIVNDFPRMRFSFLVMNPSSYTYLNKYRRDEHGQFQASPNAVNHYKYGLLELNEYAKKSGDKHGLRRQFINRNVIYAVGQSDNNPQHDELDRGDAAMTQGSQRLERGRNYFYHLQHYFPRHRHRYIEVADVGHDADGMYAAPNIANMLFK